MDASRALAALQKPPQGWTLNLLLRAVEQANNALNTELPDGEQLRECVNSGQVSAAQVVVHQQTGEEALPPHDLHSARRELAKWLNEEQIKPIDRQALAVVLAHVREAVAHQEAGELHLSKLMFANSEDYERFLIARLKEAEAARREAMQEAARLLAEIEAIREDASDWARYVIEDNAPLSLENYIEREMDRRAAITAKDQA